MSLVPLPGKGNLLACLVKSSRLLPDSVVNDDKHDFAFVTKKADSSVVLAILQIFAFGYEYEDCLSLCSGHCWVFQIILQS